MEETTDIKSKLTELKNSKSLKVMRIKLGRNMRRMLVTKKKSHTSTKNSDHSDFCQESFAASDW
eukprot:8777659-Ditylum_brightwellii.AAC.1